MAGSTYLEQLAAVRHLAATGEARRRRIAAGFSLSEVAAAAGADPSSVWRWETGRRRPRGKAALRYLRVLDSLAALETREVA
jgi:transcriptional regulator with XRE-family HTH domain